MKILVVENSQPVRERLLALLANSGRYEGIACAASSAVLMLSEIPQPAALLVDVRLNGSNGFQLLTDLRALGFNTPVVMLSASNDTQYPTHAEALGANAFLSKTRDFEKIIPTLDRLLQTAVMSANDPTWAAIQGGLSPTVSDAAAAVIRQSHGGSRILVVDDQPLNLEVARVMLEDTGLVVDTAADGAIAVAMVWQAHYAAILMDMQMPNVDGLEATRQIRAIPNYLQTPIIAMTANTAAEARTSCLEAGMNDFMSKPFDADLLIGMLLQWLNQCDRQRSPR